MRGTPAAWLVAVAGVGLAGAAVADQLPPRRAGLWETRLTAGFGGAPSVIRTCVDPARDAHAAAAAMAHARPGSGAGAGACAGLGPMTRTPTGWSFHQTCASGPNMKVDYQGTITGDPTTHYTMTMVQRFIPPPTPQLAETKSVTEDRWLGPCPAGMAPGTTTVNGRPAPRSPG